MLPMNNRVEFKLKFLLNSLTLKVLDVRDLSDPKKVLSFNNRFCDSRKIQGFTAEIADVSKFPMFSVPLAPNSKVHRVYFCEVAVGRSLFVSNEYAQTLDVPADHDSFIVSEHDTKGFLVDHEVDVSALSHVIKDLSRILPLYEIVFEYDEELERLSRKSFICHKCKRQQAVMFCPSERASFCKECDEQIHCDEFLRRHGRIYFADVGQKKFICCAQHPTKVVEYFCETCMDPICTDCKIRGSHADREKFDHHIIPFLEACQLLRARIFEHTQPVESLIEGCGREIGRFKEKVRGLKDNIASVRRQIELEFRDLMLELDGIENSQRQIANAKYVEKLVDEASLRRTESYPNELDPADLLSEFKGISELATSGSQIVFEKFEPEKIELHGKISLSVPRDGSPKAGLGDSRDKAIRWRIETMHMTKEQDAGVH